MPKNHSEKISPEVQAVRDMVRAKWAGVVGCNGVGTLADVVGHEEAKRIRDEQAATDEYFYERSVAQYGLPEHLEIPEVYGE